MSKVFYEKYIVDNEDTLLNYLRKVNTKNSKNNYKTYLSKDMVKVNNNIITKHDFNLKKGDVIEIKNNYIINKKYNVKIEIIYEDEDMIVINKPSGLLSISTDKEKNKTAYSIIRDYLIKNNKNNKIFVVHRLDKDTSGVIIYAKNLKTKSLLQNLWDKNVIEKEYTAIIEGKMEEDKGTIKSYLIENNEGFVHSTKNRAIGRYAQTNYEVLKTNKKYQMLKVNIKTGRKNQIRVHLSELGYPIVGDKKYGSKIDPIKRLCLHSRKIVLISPINKRKMTFECKVPFNMRSML